MWYFILVFFCFATVTSNEIIDEFHKQQKTYAIDIFIEKLKIENWEKNETICLEKTISLLENVKNFTLWATWVWNANTLPSGHLYSSWISLGNYDQCMSSPWLESHPELKTQYCMVEMKLTDGTKKVEEYDPYGSTEDYLNTPTIVGVPVNLLQWGLCMPSSCPPSAVIKISKSLHDLTNFGRPATNVTVLDCQVAGEVQEFQTGFYLFMLLIATLITITAVSTYYRSHVSSDDQARSFTTIITKAFCFTTNKQELVKNIPEDIKVMNGIRFLTAATVVFVHKFFYMIMAGTINAKTMDDKANTVFGYILHSNIIVDTFFAMSGLLHFKGLLANVDKQQNLFNVLWKRYIRLIGPFSVIIFFIIAVLEHIGSGPLWAITHKLEADVCADTWKSSFLMMNNDPKYICHGVTWYVPCDYQLAVLGTFLFYLYKKNRTLGYTAFGVAATLAVLIPGVLIYWHQLPPILFLDLSRVLNIRDYWELYYTYTSSYSRGGAYLVGAAMGYLMTVYKPADYRNTISKNCSIMGTAICLGAMGYIVSLGKYYMSWEYEPFEAAVVGVLFKIFWGICICGIIGFCEYGTVPIVSDILGFSYFVPLSRLSYGVYMIHPLVIQRDILTNRSPQKFDLFSIYLSTLGTLAITLCFSFAMWVLVEAPLINLTNQLLSNKSNNVQPVKKSETNGIQNKNGVAKSKTS